MGLAFVPSERNTRGSREQERSSEPDRPGGAVDLAAAPDAAVPAIAGLRSKHNTYMSIPLIFFMVSNHFPTVYGSDYAWAFALAFVAVGWGIAKFLYGKAASPAPAQY